MRRAVLALGLAIGVLALGAIPAQAANIVVGPYGLSFGPQRIGTTSTPQRLSVVLSSFGPGGAHFSGLQIVDPGSTCAPYCAPVPQPDFGATTDCGGAGVTGGAGGTGGSTSCHIDVTFHPAQPPSGPRSATIWVLSTGGNYHAPLFGTAVAPPKKKCKKHKSGAAQVAKKRCKKKR